MGDESRRRDERRDQGPRALGEQPGAHPDGRVLDGRLPGRLPAEGRRVRLREWRAEDLPSYASWIMPPESGGEHAWQRTDGPFYPNFTTESARRWLVRLGERVEAGDWAAAPDTAVIAEAATDRFLGQVSWYHAEKPTEDPGTGTRLLPLYSIGVSIYPPEFWSGGFGSEAVRLWIGHLFTATDAHRLDLETWSGNRGMCRVAQKLGFTEEARIRRARLVEGVHYDRMVYGMLREEWEAGRAQG